MERRSGVNDGATVQLLPIGVLTRHPLPRRRMHRAGLALAHLQLTFSRSDTMTWSN